MSIGHNRHNHGTERMVSDDVAAYLARGGKIQQVESGYSVESERWKQLTAQQRYLSSGSTMGIKLADK